MHETEAVPPPVPERYRGVWVRTLLATPTLRDDTTFVRWLQTASWHADLRVPVVARSGSPTPEPRLDAAATAGQRLALQQGFCGRTTVDVGEGHEWCTWHRRHDFQPPRPDPDAGRIVFDGPDRMLEYGVHSPYEEVWERLPGSVGPSAVLVRAPLADGQGTSPTLLMIAGRFAMWVRPRSCTWPADTSTTDSLLDLVPSPPPPCSRLCWTSRSPSGRLAVGIGRSSGRRCRSASRCGSAAVCVETAPKPRPSSSAPRVARGASSSGTDRAARSPESWRSLRTAGRIKGQKRRSPLEAGFEDTLRHQDLGCGGRI